MLDVEIIKLNVAKNFSFNSTFSGNFFNSNDVLSLQNFMLFLISANLLFQKKMANAFKQNLNFNSL